MAKFPPYKTKYLDFSLSIKQVLAEFLALTIFVFVGCGTAVFFSRIATESFVQQQSTGAAAQAQVDLFGQQKQLAQTLQTNGNWGVTTAFAFGFAIMYLVYTFWHISGGQCNCAVTLALVLSGHLGLVQGIGNFVGQLVGSLLGAGLLYSVVPDANSSSLGANSIARDFTVGNAVMGEIVMTFVLCFVVQMTACWPKSFAKNLAPFAIGMVVFSAHAVLLPVDGCSINPTRSFGPAVVSGTYNNFWVFWVGPLSGAIISVPFYWLFRSPWDTVPVNPEVEEEEEQPVKKVGKKVDQEDVPAAPGTV